MPGAAPRPACCARAADGPPGSGAPGLGGVCRVKCWGRVGFLDSCPPLYTLLSAAQCCLGEVVAEGACQRGARFLRFTEGIVPRVTLEAVV